MRVGREHIRRQVGDDSAGDTILRGAAQIGKPSALVEAPDDNDGEDKSRIAPEQSASIGADILGVAEAVDTPAAVGHPPVAHENPWHDQAKEARIFLLTQSTPACMAHSVHRIGKLQAGAHISETI